MGLLSGGPTFGGIFHFKIWWAYYSVGLLSGGLTYGILRYYVFRKKIEKCRNGENRDKSKI